MKRADKTFLPTALIAALLIGAFAVAYLASSQLRPGILAEAGLGFGPTPAPESSGW